MAKFLLYSDFAIQKPNHILIYGQFSESNKQEEGFWEKRDNHFSSPQAFQNNQCIDCEMDVSDNLPDFVLKLFTNSTSSVSFSFDFKGQNYKYTFCPKFAFRQFKGFSAIGCCVKFYNHRIIEWLNHVHALGFDKVFLFNNEGNQNIFQPNKNQNLEKNQTRDSMIPIVEDLSYVEMCNFPYGGENQWNLHWRNIYRAYQNILYHSIRESFHFLIYLEPDEFPFIHNRFQNINDFLKNQNTHLLLKNKIITTNRPLDINNNALTICNFDAGDSPTKSFIHLKSLQRHNFIRGPHNPMQVKLTVNESECVLRHAWHFDRIKNSGRQIMRLHSFI